MRVEVASGIRARPGKITFCLDIAYGYLLALALIAAGLFGIMIESVYASLLSWTARVTQFLSGVYMVIAAFASVRESHAWGIPLEEALRESEERFKVLAAATFEGIAITEGGRFTDANEQLFKMLGYSRAELVGKGVAALLLPEDRERVMSSILAGRESLIESPMVRKDGARIIVEAHGRTVDYQQRKVRLTAIRDITERKRAEQALRASEERYHSLFNGMTEGFALHEIICDADGTPCDYRFLDINPAFERLTGLKREHVVGKTHNEILPGDSPKWVQAYGAVALTGEPVQFGDYSPALRRHYEVFAYRPAPCQFAALFMDITERKRLEQERDALLNSERAARNDAERASRAKDEFISTLSHELRNPLNAILGWAQLVKRPRRTAADIAEGLEIIESSGRALADMISDLLDLSRITSGKLRLDIQTVDLHAVIAAAVAAARPAIEGKGIRLETTLDTAAAPVRGDPNRLQQIVWNLLSNAAKFTDRGGRVEIGPRRIDPQFEIRVSDTGQGIEPDFLPHIFERFRQEDASAAKKHGGLGLGLAIVRHLVELHGGTVRAASPGRGQGATFTVRLPVQAVIRTVEPPEQPLAGPTGPATIQYEEVILDGVRVLAVDDERESLELVKRVLEERRAQVFTAASAAEGMQLLPQARPDVIVSDIGMPGEDGYQFMRRVRALGPELGGTTPAVALTAFAGVEHRQHANLAGYQAHLAKPVEVAQLVLVVARLAGRLACEAPGQEGADGEAGA